MREMYQTCPNSGGGADKKPRQIWNMETPILLTPLLNFQKFLGNPLTTKNFLFVAPLG